MRVKLLGSGASEGVPVLGCCCKVCLSKNQKNKRYRQSLYFENKGTKLLIDCGPDFKYQMMNNGLSDLDGVLLTHAHFDHIGGLNDMRSVSALRKSPVPVYSDDSAFVVVDQCFGYLFKNMVYINDRKDRIPAVTKVLIDTYKEYQVGNVVFSAFLQKHGSITSLGFKFKDFVYSTDLKGLSDKSLDFIRNANVWFVDCLGYGQYRGHFNVDETLYWIKNVKPKRAILIHMSHDIDYDELSAKLPRNVVLGYDNMEIKV